MTTVRWDEPIEAVHDDGRVVSVELDFDYPQPDRDGEYALKEGPPGYEKEDLVFRDGTNASARVPWRIRNVGAREQERLARGAEGNEQFAKSAKIPPALVDRMVALVRRMHKRTQPGGHYETGPLPDDYDVAVSIHAELPEELDDGWLEAKAFVQAQGWLESDTNYDSAVALARDALRRGKQMAGGE